MKYIVDEEINLNDNDLLETKKYVTTLKEIVLSSESKQTIGLFGEWGTGKSSIIKTVQEELESEEQDKKIKFIVYDAWKYSGDSFRRMFIRTLSDQLGFNLSEEIDNFYYDKTEEIEEKKLDLMTVFKNIGLFVLMSFIILWITFYISSDKLKSIENIEWLVFIPIVISAIGIFLNNAYQVQKKVVQYNKFFAPEQFENLINELLGKSLKQYSIYARAKEFVSGNSFEKDLDKIVIVIDNIDRCDSETSYSLLTNIKNFLANKEGVLFLIPIDDEALKRHLNIEKNSNEKEADEFLRKFFSMTLKIKHFQPTDLFRFTSSLNKKYDLGLNPNTIDIISKEYATNPRRIIQILNNLTTELNLIKNKIADTDVGFLEKNQSLIAILLIVREEWMGLYRKIVESPHIIKDKEIPSISDSQGLFLKGVRAIIDRSDMLSIEKIILNIDNDSTLSREIIELINNAKYDELSDFIEEENNFGDLVEYLIEELNKETKRGTFDTSALKRFEDILIINTMKRLKNSHLNKAKAIIEDNQLKLIENLDQESFNAFFDFLNLNHSHNIGYLYVLALNKFSKIWDVDDSLDDGFSAGDVTIWYEGLESFINHLEDTQLIKDSLSNLYVQYYKYHNTQNSIHFFKNGIIEDDKEKLVFNRDIAYFIVDNIQFGIYLDDKKEIIMDDYQANNYFQELEYLTEKKLLSAKDIHHLFKPIEISGVPFAQNNTIVKSKMLELISSLIISLTNVILNVKKEKVNSEYIRNFITFLSSNQRFSYNNNAGYADNFLYLNEISIDLKYQQALLKLYLELYRITLNNSDTSTSIRQLVNKYPDLKEFFYDELLLLNEKENISFVSIFKDDLLAENSHSNNLLELYNIIFQDDKMNQDLILDKIEMLILEILNEEDNKVLNGFIENLLKKEKLKNIVTKTVVGLDLDKIKSLPLFLQRLTYDYLCDENKVFELEKDFLLDMLVVDAQAYKGCVLKVVKSMLPDGRKLSTIFELLDNLKYLTTQDKSEIYNELIKHKDSKNYSKEVKSYSKKLKAN